MANVNSNTADKLKEVQRYVLDFGGPVQKVQLYAEYRQQIKMKELIFKITALDANSNPIGSGELSWSYSKIAGANYVYSPPGNANTISALPDLISNQPFSQLIVTPVRWGSSGTSPDALVQDLWAVRQAFQERDGSSFTLGQILTVSSKES